MLEHQIARSSAERTDVRHGLAQRIRRLFTASDGTYGYRRIYADLAAEGTECSPELARQITCEAGLVPCQPRPFRMTTSAGIAGAAGIGDLIERDFSADRPGVKFVGDIPAQAGGAPPTSTPGKGSSIWPR